jgi:hypothetical protein
MAEVTAVPGTFDDLDLSEDLFQLRFEEEEDGWDSGDDDKWEEDEEDWDDDEDDDWDEDEDEWEEDEEEDWEEAEEEEDF